MTTLTADFDAHLRKLPAPIYLGQLRLLPGWWLGHRDDLLPLQTASPLIHLRERSELREWIKYSPTGAFRPVRGFRNLRPGWKMGPFTTETLVDLLHLIYPGSVADWVYQQQGTLPVTEFSETAARQTGMYRITQLLTGTQLEELTRDACDAQCVRLRLWKPIRAGERARSELPVYCPEACNYLVGQAREKIKAERASNS